VRAEQLRRHLAEKLPEYMVPIAYVRLEKLPLTANGKVDRKNLPSPPEAEHRHDYVKPGTTVEEMLCGIWAEVLHLEHVGIHDNFFAIGGHSLTATRAVSRIRKALGLELPLRHLFECPTIAELSSAINQTWMRSNGGTSEKIGRVSRQQWLPLSYGQQRLWMIDQIDPGNSAYNVNAALRLKGELKIGILESAVQDVIRRHEALRTHFICEEGVPHQVIDQVTEFRAEVVDLRGWVEKGKEALKWVYEECRRGFDLQRGPLLRMTVVCLEEYESILILNMHHIVSDDWSLGILLREVSALYRAGLHGEKLKLVEPDIQYADFACWQRKWFEERELARQLEYWQQQLSGSGGLLELRTDYPRPPVKKSAGTEIRFAMEDETSERLRRLGRKEDVTLFMVLLAAVQVLLWRYTGQNDINIGVPIANRNREEIEGLIGFFVNMLVMRIKSTGNETFAELLKQVRTTALGAYVHQDMPFDKLVEELQPERDVAHAPLFQVTFVLQNVGSSMMELEGLEISEQRRASTISNYDLSIEAYENEGRLWFVLRYDVALFHPITIERMGIHLQS
jgi:acyl carrier protein